MQKQQQQQQQQLSNGSSRSNSRASASMAAAGSTQRRASGSSTKSGGSQRGGSLQRRGSGASNGSAGSGGASRRQYRKSYSSYKDESIAAETVISLGSIDELGDSVVPDELIERLGMQSFTTDEKCHLDNMMQRYHAAELGETARKEKLRRELLSLLAQASHVQDSSASTEGLFHTYCELCGCKLMFYHRRYMCQRCDYQVCRNCVKLLHNNKPYCGLCHLESLTEAQSGEWFLSAVHSRQETTYFGPELLRASLRKERIRMVTEEKQRREQRANEALADAAAAAESEAAAAAAGAGQHRVKKQQQAVDKKEKQRNKEEERRRKEAEKEEAKRKRKGGDGGQRPSVVTFEKTNSEVEGSATAAAARSSMGSSRSSSKGQVPSVKVTSDTSSPPLPREMTFEAPEPEINPEDSASAVDHIDYADHGDSGDEILLEQATFAGPSSGEQQQQQQQQHHLTPNSNLQLIDAAPAAAAAALAPAAADLSLNDVIETASALQEFLVGYAQRRVSISCPDLPAVASAAASVTASPNGDAVANVAPVADAAAGVTKANRRLSIPVARLFTSSSSSSSSSRQQRAAAAAGPQPGDRRVSISNLPAELLNGMQLPPTANAAAASSVRQLQRRLSTPGFIAEAAAAAAAQTAADAESADEEEGASAAADNWLRVGETSGAGSFLTISRCTSMDSMASNVSENENSFRKSNLISGDIEVSLAFDFKCDKLSVGIRQCRNLASIDNSPPNPYVKTYLLPDKTKRSKKRTEVKRATANPIYSQTLTYDISKSELESRCLQISVWHRVTLGSNIFMGEIRIPMDVYRFKNQGSTTYPLEDRREVSVPLPSLMYRGDILLSLRYVTAEFLKQNQLQQKADRHANRAGRLEVWVQSCKNLAGSGSSACPYVKGYLLPDKRAKSKQKSAIAKGDVNPNFNSILAFENVQLIELKDRALELTVWDHVRFGSNDFLGGVRLNMGLAVQHRWMDAKGHEQMMWSAMIEKPNTWIEGSLLLRPNMDPEFSVHS